MSTSERADLVVIGGGPAGGATAIVGPAFNAAGGALLAVAFALGIGQVHGQVGSVATVVFELDVEGDRAAVR